MSKTLRATPIWLGGVCSNEAFLSSRLAVVPNVVTEQLPGKYCDNLKYVQAKSPQYKHVQALCRKSDELFQKVLIVRGGKQI
jgi:hypothetical protein